MRMTSFGEIQSAAVYVTGSESSFLSFEYTVCFQWQLLFRSDAARIF